MRDLPIPTPIPTAIDAAFLATEAWFEASLVVIDSFLECLRMACLAYVETEPTAVLREASV